MTPHHNGLLRLWDWLWQAARRPSKVAQTRPLTGRVWQVILIPIS